MKKFLFDINIKNKYILNKYKDYIILDVETTGLSREKDIIFIIGLLEIKSDSKVKIYFLDSLDEEAELLKSIDFNKKNIITYNGESFDLPFIKNKISKYKLGTFQYESIDLYRYIKNYKYILNLERYRLKDIEKFIGFYRKSFISGKDISNMYREYLITKDENLLDNLVNHNKDDLLGLLKSMEVIEYIENKLTLSLYDNNFLIENIQFQNNFINISGSTNLNYDISVNEFNYNLNIENHKLIINIEINENYYDAKRKCKYLLTKDYPSLVDKSNLNSPKEIFIIYLDKILYGNVIQLIEYILKKSISNLI
ncbi:MAG: ribonuclease H-like domain-containing protein [Peptoniphilaceae bacterium]